MRFALGLVLGLLGGAASMYFAVAAWPELVGEVSMPVAAPARPAAPRVAAAPHVQAAGEPAAAVPIVPAETAVEQSFADQPMLKPTPPLQTPPKLAPGDVVIPVVGARREDLRDMFDDRRGTRAHRAIDIMAPRGTPVLAAIDGSVGKLFLSRAGGITVYQYDPTKAWIYYYAHLDAYAPGLAEGQQLRRGDVIGFVGTTGNAPPDAPHLHFAIEKLTEPGKWWKSEPIDPYPLLKEHGVTVHRTAS